MKSKRLMRGGKTRHVVIATRCNACAVKSHTPTLNNVYSSHGIFIERFGNKNNDNNSVALFHHNYANSSTADILPIRLISVGAPY